MALSELRRAGHFPTLVAALVYFDVSFMAWTLLGALGPTVAADLGLSAAGKGAMVATPVLAGALLRPVVGLLADRHGARRVGLATMAATLVPLLWGAIGGTSWVQVLGIGLLLGVAGASFAVALPIASRSYPPAQQGLALGIVGMGNSGSLVATVLAPRIAERIGWHGTFAVAVLPVVAAAAVFAVLTRDSPSSRSPAARAALGAPGLAPGPGPVTRARLPLTADVAWLAGFYAVTFGGFVGLTGYLPIFFVDRFHLAAPSAGALAALCAALGSAGRPLGGLLADRAGGTRVLTAVLLAVGGLSLLLVQDPGLAGTTVVLTAVMTALGLGNGAVFQLVPARFPRRVGTVTGVVGAAGGLGGFALPLALGVLHGRTGGFGAGFLVLCAAALTMAAAAGGRHRAWTDAIPLPERAA